MSAAIPPADPAAENRLVTCVVQKGVAVPVLRALKERYGLVASNVTNARGVGHATPLVRRGLGGQGEREILTVVVPAEQADEIFEFVFHEAGVDRPHGGIVYLGRLDRALPFALPDLPEEV